MVGSGPSGLVKGNGHLSKAGEASELICCQVTIQGTVQGVGMRPFLFRLAGKHGLAGEVANAGQGVVLQLEGPALAVEACLEELTQQPPPLARISHMAVENCLPRGYWGFSVALSHTSRQREGLIPPDVAICPDCRREVLDPADRHHLYPFTNCTNCGPRFTITRDLPLRPGKNRNAAFYPVSPVPERVPESG